MNKTTNWLVVVGGGGGGGGWWWLLLLVVVSYSCRNSNRESRGKEKEREGKRGGIPHTYTTTL